MNRNAKIVGGGYLQSAVRFEARPGCPDFPETFDTKANIRKQLNELQKAGVQSWWHSVSSGQGEILFPSKCMPHHPGAKPGFYEWLTEETHRRDMIAVSWAFMSTSSLFLAKHPECRMRALKRLPGDAVSKAAFQKRKKLVQDTYGQAWIYPCYNSAYGDALKDLCVEITKDLGFDVVWFDGAFVGCWWSGWEGPMGCCCPRCARLFRREVGREIPKYVDWSNPDFRRFLVWRRQSFMRFWRDLCLHVQARKPTALIAFNNFQRIGHQTGEGCPLDFADCNGLIGAEIDQIYEEGLMQMSYLRAINKAEYPPEIWMHPQPYGPHPDPSNMVYYGLQCMTAGGFPSYGAVARPKELNGINRTLADALKPIAPFVGGEPVRSIGLVLSANTKDFGFDGNEDPVWRSVHGMYNLFTHAHWPVDAVLDNQVTAGHLEKFNVVALSNVRCLSDTQANALRAYVKQGGLLLATQGIGLRNEFGDVRPHGALDDLLGIRKWNFDRQASGIIRPQGAWAELLPPSMTVDGVGLGLEANEYPAPVRVDFIMKGVKVLARSDDDRHPAVVTRRFGKGRVIYINRDIGNFYSHAPFPHYRKLVMSLLSAYAEPPYRVEAAPHVVVTMWKQAGNRWVAHILSQTGELRRIRGDYMERRTAIDFSATPPAGTVTLHMPWKAKTAERPVSGKPLSIKHSRDGSVIRVDNVGWHDVVALK